MYKKLIFIYLTLILSLSGFAQILNPLKLSVSHSPQKLKVGDEVTIHLNVTLEDSWHFYASEMPLKDGPMPATLENIEIQGAKISKGLHTPKAKEVFDDIFEGKVRFIEHQGELVFKIKITNENPKIKAILKGQVCTEEGKCVPIKENFTWASTALPGEKTTQATVNKTDTSKSTSQEIVKDTSKSNIESAKIAPKTISKSKPKSTENESLLGFMLLAFLSGLAALVTPCVFPMIPMTVSFFTNSYKNRSKAIFSALVYAFSIVFIYTLIGTLVAFLFGAGAANFISTHWLPNLIFFVVFIVFALSFFGLFEITLPSWLVNKVDQQSEKGGFYGVFFMALTIVLVSFSCTGPIASSLLVQASGGDLLKPALGMFAFGLAFAIPFGLFAIFPSWLQTLPKSGSWLGTVKVVLGFVELALAFKFLSTADLVYHWELLSRDLYLAILIAISLALTFYLWGILKINNENHEKGIGVTRLILGISTLTFVFYLLPGLFGAPLKALAGYLPPLHTQQFVIGGQKNNVIQNQCPATKLGSVKAITENGFLYLDEAIACAKTQNKPIFIDFTGHGCQNCRKMEENVLIDPQIKQSLETDFVVVSLYVDDKTNAPTSKQTKNKNGEILSTIGDINANYQIEKFNSNAQPQYAIIDAEGNLLTSETKFFDLNISNFASFLEEGKKNSKK